MKFLIIVLMLTLVLGSCEGQNKSLPAKEENNVTSTIEVHDHISVIEARKLISSKKDLVLLDVRTPGEISQGKISNAIEMDYNSSGFKTNLSKLDKNQEYLVYCAVGGRSSGAMQIMKTLGFKKVHNMSGGFTAWKSNKG